MRSRLARTKKLAMSISEWRKGGKAGKPEAVGPSEAIRARAGGASGSFFGPTSEGGAGNEGPNQVGAEAPGVSDEAFGNDLAVGTGSSFIVREDTRR